MTDLNELSRLLEQATPGPWIADPVNRNLVARDGDIYEYICEVAPSEFSVSTHTQEQEAANAALIAALRNHAEALIRDARRYRYVRRKPEITLHWNGTDIDAAVDAAIAQEQP